MKNEISGQFYEEIYHYLMLYIRDGFPEQRQIILDPAKRAKWERTPFANALRITDVGHFPQTHYHFVDRPKGVAEHILILNISGKGWLRTGKRLWIVPQKHAAFIRASAPHAYGSNDSIPWNIYWLHFLGPQADAFMEWRSSLLADPVFPVIGVDELIELFESFLRQCINPVEKLDILKLTTVMNQILLQILAGREENKQGSRVLEGRVLKSIHHMQESLDQNLSLEELARVATLSIPHYSSLFKSHTGSSPLRFFTRLRLRKACELLENPEMTVQATAYALGFNDAFYFGRIFKRFIGVSPSRYRREMDDRGPSANPAGQGNGGFSTAGSPNSE